MSVGLEERIERAREKIAMLDPARGLLSEDLKGRIRQEELYIEAVLLRMSGSGPSRMAEELRVRPSIVSNWLYREKEPLGHTNVPDFRLREAVAHFLAATNTDASVYGRTFISLNVIDYELAKDFARALSDLLGRNVGLTDDKGPIWRVSLSSIFLADIARKVREEPELISDFLESDELKREYCRLFFAYDGGPHIHFNANRSTIDVDISVSEDKGRLDALANILDDLGIHCGEPYSRGRVYEVFISDDDNVRRFAREVGIRSYKNCKLLDALWLKDRMEQMIERGADQSDAFKWSKGAWETFYVNLERIGYVPHWFAEAREILHRGTPLRDRVAVVEDIYTRANDEALCLRSLAEC